MLGSAIALPFGIPRMLIFGFVHAVFIGTDFENTIILTICSILFAGVIVSFIL